MSVKEIHTIFKNLFIPVKHFGVIPCFASRALTPTPSFLFLKIGKFLFLILIQVKLRLDCPVRLEKGLCQVYCCARAPAEIERNKTLNLIFRKNVKGGWVDTLQVKHGITPTFGRYPLLYCPLLLPPPTGYLIIGQVRLNWEQSSTAELGYLRYMPRRFRAAFRGQARRNRGEGGTKNFILIKIFSNRILPTFVHRSAVNSQVIKFKYLLRLRILLSK